MTRVGETVRVGRIFGTVVSIDEAGVAIVRGARWEWVGPADRLITEEALGRNGGTGD